MDIFLLSFLFSIGVNIAMFVPAFIYKTDKLTDISYAATFGLVALFAFFNSTMTDTHFLFLAAVLLWAVRLGSFLFMRINYMKRDKRFDGMRENFWAFLRFWVLQGATVPVVMLPTLFVFSQNTLNITAVVVLGLGLAMVGLVLEALADQEKFNFNKKKSNKGKWIDTGVWRISRHPNYLGEITMWVGVYVAAFTLITSIQQLVGLLSPGFITALLLFVSGIPTVEKTADEKWGKDKKYQKYKKEVPVLVPTPHSLRRLGK